MKRFIKIIICFLLHFICIMFLQYIGHYNLISYIFGEIVFGICIIIGILIGDDD